MQASSIRYVSRTDVDVQKWNHCIKEFKNGLIYGYSHYLDRMCKHWDALILDDYRAVMPLTWNRKGGIYYLYQPAFTPCLGVFGNEINETLVTDFLTAIPKKFQLVEISLNPGSMATQFPPDDIEYLKRKNLVLPLVSPYDHLYNNYNDNIKRNIRKAITMGCEVKKNIPVEEIISLAKNQLNDVTNLSKQDYENFNLLYGDLAPHKKAITYGIYHNGQLLSGAVYFFSHRRAYYILVGNHPNGKTMGTSHYLIDRFIADHAGLDIILDFEGSDISSLAFFYKSFGAAEETFLSIKWNRLPWYVKWLK